MEHACKDVFITNAEHACKDVVKKQIHRCMRVNYFFQRINACLLHMQRCMLKTHVCSCVISKGIFACWFHFKQYLFACVFSIGNWHSMSHLSTGGGHKTGRKAGDWSQDRSQGRAHKTSHKTGHKAGDRSQDRSQEPSRSGPGRAEPSRAEPGRPSQAELGRAEPSRAEPSQTKPIRAEPYQTEPSRDEPEATHAPYVPKNIMFYNELCMFRPPFKNNNLLNELDYFAIQKHKLL